MLILLSIRIGSDWTHKEQGQGRILVSVSNYSVTEI